MDAAGAVVEEFESISAGPDPNYGEPGYYLPLRALLGQPGQTYTLRAAAPGLKPVEATMTMPFPTVIESAEFSIRPAAGNYGADTPGRLTVTIQDNAATTDYYFATARLLDAQGRPSPLGSVKVDYDSQENTAQVGQFQLSNSFTNDYDIYRRYQCQRATVHAQFGCALQPARLLRHGDWQLPAANLPRSNRQHHHAGRLPLFAVEAALQGYRGQPIRGAGSAALQRARRLRPLCRFHGCKVPHQTVASRCS